MSVDTKIALPYRVRLRDAAQVLGLLLGSPGYIAPLGQGSIHLVVPGVKVRSYGDDVSGLTECAKITIEGCTVGPWPEHEFMWHFEPEDDSVPERHTQMRMMPRSNPEIIAAAIGLVDFFGGAVQYQDSTSSYDYVVPADFSGANWPSNNPEWDEFQKRMAAVKPVVVTYEHVRLSAYGDHDRTPVSR